jgi:hypothetical protein
MKKSESFAALYFKRLAKIRSLEGKLNSLRSKNKKLLKSNPWIGNLVGIAKKSIAVGEDSSASYDSSSEEVKEPVQKALASI